MTFAPGKHIYLAAPFFNEKQREVCSFIESLETGPTIIYSPRKDGGVLTPNASLEEIEMTFNENTRAIESAWFVVAVIDDFDPGTIWEIGYAHGKNIPVLGYSDVPGRGLNVMLAGSCRLGFVNSRSILAQAILPWNEFPKNTWSGEIQ